MVAGIIQTFIKSWNQLLYPRVTKVCRLPFEPRHDFFLHFVVNISPSFGEFTAPLRHFLPIHNVTINRINLFVNILWTCTFCVEKSHDGSKPRIWRDFGLALPFQTRLTQTNPVLPLSNEYGSQVKDQGRRQCCNNKRKKFSYRPTGDVSLLFGHALYKYGDLNSQYSIY